MAPGSAGPPRIPKLAPLVIPEGGFRKPFWKRLHVVWILALAAVFAIAIQHFVFSSPGYPTDLGDKLGPTHHVRDLSGQLLPAPAGAQPCATAQPAGALDLAHAAPSASVAAELGTMNFSDAAGVCWKDPDGDEVTVRILRFVTDGNAQAAAAKLLSAVPKGDSFESKNLGIVVLSRPAVDGPIVGYAYGTRGVLTITVQVTPTRLPNISRGALTALYDAQWDLIKKNQAQ